MDVEKIRGLSKGALRIGFLLLNLGTKASILPTKEVMRLTGIADTSTFYKAKRELIDAGFLTKPMEGTFALPRFTSSAEGTERSVVTDRLDSFDYAGSINQSICLSSAIPQPPLEPGYMGGVGNIPLTGGNYTPTDWELYPYSGNSSPTSGNSSPSVGNIPLPLSLYERCQEVDVMDASGDVRDAHSPFGIRRRAQYPLMKEVWQQIFPGHDIPEESMFREFLQLCDNSVAQFHDDIELIKVSAKQGINNAKTYIRSSLRNRKNEPEPAPRPTIPRPVAKPVVSSAKPGAQTGGANGDAIGADELIPDTPEKKREREETRRKYAKLFAEDDE